MTLPDERYRAVKMARDFLLELTNPKKTPGVPSIIRSQASSILRHYPSTYDMTRACAYVPDIFQSEIEPVSRMIMQYEQGKNNEA